MGEKVFQNAMLTLGVIFGGLQVWLQWQRPADPQSSGLALVTRPIGGPLLVAVLFLCAGLLHWIPLRKLSRKNKTKLEDFRNPEWETVIGKSFKNEEVILDKKRFWNCTFDNVTLRFKGEGPVEFMHGCNFTPNMILASNSPVAMEYAKLLEIFGSLPNTQAKHVSVDKDGKPLAPTFQVTELIKNRRAEDKAHN